MKSTQLYKIYTSIGRIAHFITKPLLRLYLARTERAYLLLICHKKALLIKNWFGDGRWALPGGGLKRNETAQTALIREIDEELGVSLKMHELSLIYVGHERSSNLKHKIYIFVTRSSLADFRINKKEIVSLEWIPVSQLTRENIDQEILDAIQKI